MILKLYLIYHILGFVFTFGNNSEEIREISLSDEEIKLEHSVDMVQSADELFAEGKSKNIIFQFFVYFP